MATLREFILNQSTLSTGNIVRDHILNPLTGGPGSGLVLSDGLEIEMADKCVQVEIDLSPVIVEVGDDLIVEIETEEYEVEVC